MSKKYNTYIVSLDDSSDEEDELGTYKIEQFKFKQGLSACLAVTESWFDDNWQAAEESAQKVLEVVVNTSNIAETNNIESVIKAKCEQHHSKDNDGINFFLSSLVDEVHKYTDLNEKIFAEYDNIMLENILSFITHAVGIYVLYNPVVQKRYYELKKEKLKNTLENTLDYKTQEELEEEFESLRHEIQSKHGDSTELEEVLSFIEHDAPSRIYSDKKQCLNYWKEDKITQYFESLISNKFPSFTENENVASYFIDFIPIKHNKRQTIETPEFDLSYASDENFVVDFLAYLRLHNRSEKRCLKNEDICVNTKWKFFAGDNWVILDNKNNQYFEDTRTEWVQYPGTKYAPYIYVVDKCEKNEIPALLEARTNIKKLHVLDGLDLSTFFSTWYLLFGCEVIRNPASIIHINMVLDLIKSGDVSWKDGILEHFPMAPFGSIPGAMTLNQEYSEYMPYKYQYQYAFAGDIAKGENLQKREAKLTAKWLKFKLGEAVSSYLLAKCSSDNEAIDAIWKLIFESFKGWGLETMPFPQEKPQSCNIEENSEADDASIALSKFHMSAYHDASSLAIVVNQNLESLGQSSHSMEED